MDTWGTWTKVGIFVGYVICYFGWLWSAGWLIQRTAGRLIGQQHGQATLMGLGISLVSVVFLFGFLWMLTGFFDLRFVALLAASHVVAAVVTAILWALVGSPQIDWGATNVWEAFKLGVGSYTTIAANLLRMLAAVVFPVIVGWYFFRLEVPSPEATLRIFQVTIVGLFLTGVLSGVMQSALTLMSPTIPEEGRSRLLIESFSGFVSIGLLVSMFAWAFGWGAVVPASQAPGIPISISWPVAAIVAGFYVLGYLLPYVAGVQRSKALQKLLNGRYAGLVSDVIDGLRKPGAAATKIATLDGIRTRIEAQQKDLIDSPAVQRAEALVRAGAGLAPSEDFVRRAYLASRGQDRKLAAADALAKLAADVTDLQQHLQQAVAGGAAFSVDDSVKYLESRLAKVAQDKEAVSPKPLLAIAFFVGPIATVMLQEVGKLLWGFVKTASGG